MATARGQFSNTARKRSASARMVERCASSCSAIALKARPTRPDSPPSAGIRWRKSPLPNVSAARLNAKSGRLMRREMQRAQTSPRPSARSAAASMISWRLCSPIANSLSAKTTTARGARAALAEANERTSPASSSPSKSGWVMASRSGEIVASIDAEPFERMIVRPSSVTTATLRCLSTSGSRSCASRSTASVVITRTPATAPSRSRYASADLIMRAPVVRPTLGLKTAIPGVCAAASKYERLLIPSLTARSSGR